MPKQKKKSRFVGHIVSRIKNGKDAYIIIVGERRSGKTIASIGLAYTISKELGQEFDPDKQNFFTVETFMAAVNKDNFLDGKVVCLQEAGVALYRRDWFKQAVKSFNSILQTIGFRKMVLIMTLPSVELMDKHAMGMANFIIRTIGIQEPDRVQAKLHTVKNYPVDGRKTHTPFYRYYEPQGLYQTMLANIFIRFAPKEIMDKVLKADIVFKESLSREAEQEILNDKLKTTVKTERVKRSATKFELPA